MEAGGRRWAVGGGGRWLGGEERNTRADDGGQAGTVGVRIGGRG